MLNVIWVALIIGSIIASFFNGTSAAVAESIPLAAKGAVTTAFGLIGIMSLWLGMMSLAEETGFIRMIAKIISPGLRLLFPEVPEDHPAMGAMILNIAANMLGLNNAATPFGLRAMEELEKLNPHPGVATNAMCTFLAINTSSVQIVPMTGIAILAASGDINATSIVVPTIIATLCSTIAGIISVKTLEKLSLFKYRSTSNGA